MLCALGKEALDGEADSKKWRPIKEDGMLGQRVVLLCTEWSPLVRYLGPRLDRRQNLDFAPIRGHINA